MAAFFMQPRRQANRLPACPPAIQAPLISLYLPHRILAADLKDRGQPPGEQLIRRLGKQLPVQPRADKSADCTGAGFMPLLPAESMI